MWYTFVFTLTCIIQVLSAIPDGETCQTYAGGNVYPHTSNPERADHKLQFTKAVSK